MTPAPSPNGRTVRTFEQDGLLISEVEFYPGDVGEYPLCLGYMVGEDDGHSTLYSSAERAITVHREKKR